MLDSQYSLSSALYGSAVARGSARATLLGLLGLLSLAQEARAQGEHGEGRGGVDRGDGGNREPRPGAVPARLVVFI